jgi:hypothetical protein
MKNIFLFLVLFISHSLFSGIIDKSDKALKFSIVITKEYAKNFSNEFSDDKENYNKLIRALSEKEPSEIIDFYNILQSSNWKGVQKKIAKPVYDNYLKLLNNAKIGERIEINDYYTTFLSKDQLKYIDIEGNDEYNELISEYIELVKDEIPKKSEESITSTQKSKSESSGFFSFNLNILHIILVIVFSQLWFFYMKSKSKNEPMEERQPQNQWSCGDCDKKAEIIKNKNTELYELKKTNQTLQEENTNLRNQKADEDSKIKIPTPTSEPNNKTEKKVFYFPGPSFAGTFRVDTASTTKKTNISIYRFELHSENSTTASVFFDPDFEMAFGRALNSPDKNILPICIEENAFNQQAKKIETIKPATARLNGDNWEIREEDKMRIRYV